MKKVLLSSALFLISFIGFSQTKGISYQAVIIDPNPIEIPGKDVTAQPYVSKDVWIRFGIYAGTTLQYEELHKTKTDEYGLVNLIIGAGVNTGKAGTFTSLSWDGVTKSIITSVSFDQGGRYTEVSNQKFTYVPYTLLAETAVKLAGVLPIASGGTGATNAIAARTNLGLGNVDNTADVDKPVSIATLAILDTKEAIANKSTNIIADSASSVKYPSVKAIKDYIDSRTANSNLANQANRANLAAKATALETPRTINGVPFDGTANITIPVGVTPPDANATTKGLVQLAGDLSGTAAAPTIAANSVTTAKIIDGAVTTGKLAAGAVNTAQVADGAITNAKITSVAGSKVTGDIAGNAATATLATTATSANTATKLTTARTINGTAFDGTTDITITTNASTLSGTIGILNGGTGASTATGARTNLGLVIGTDVLAQRTFGTAANSAATDFVAATEKGANNGVATLGNNGKIPSTQIPAISFQNVNVVNSDAAMIGIAGAQVGSIAIRTDNNNNYVLSALPASTLSNWIALATPIYVSTVNGYAGPNVVLTTNDVAEGTTNKYFTDARVRNAISATAPLNFNTTSGVLSMTAASGSSDGYLSSADFTRFNNKQTALTAGVDYATPSGNITGNAANVTGIVSIANGGTGTSTAAGALVALGAEPSANKSNDVDGDGSSITKFPTVKSIKDYVDRQSANAGVADNSITSAKINGTIAIAKGGTGASTAAGARTNLGLAIGTDVMAANATTALTGDVSGSGNGSFATTVNSVGGVSSSTIATLPGLITTNTNAIAANTASITANSNSIATLNTNVAANTTSITANATAIATNTASIATNATAITTEATTARAAELTLTNNVNANTASITANTNSIATLNTNVSANTASITANTTAIATNTASIATNATAITTEATTARAAELTLTNSVNANTASITANANSIATLNTNVSANTASITANSNDIATINTNLALKAPLASPAFTGTPTAPTPATNDNSTKVATTEYVKASITAASAGLSTIGAISGTSNAKGATISGTSELILTPADASNGGVVTTGAQTFAGAKTFSNTANFLTDIKVNGMNVGRPGMPTYTENTALGFGVLGSYAPTSSTYSYNTGVGNNALRSLTNGGNNTAVGNNALYSAATSRFNTAIGTDALFASTGSNNVGVGTNSGVKLTTGRDNVMVGYIAGFGMTTGSNNTIVGSQTYSQTAGAIQIGLGITTGSNNTIIGSKIFGLAPNLSNNVILADGDGNIRAQHDGTTGWTLGTITSGIWSATTIDIAKGGTGATTAAAALTNLGAEASANKSTATDLGNTSPSDILFPTQKAVKTYVDAQTASAGVSDGSITNAKLAGSITASNLVGTDITSVGTITTGTWSASVIDIAHGGTGSSTVTGAKTNLGLNNVENTALSTWTGSPYITSVGSLAAAGKTFTFQDLVLGSGTTQGKISTDGGKPIQFFPTYNVESTRMWANGNVTIQTGGTFTDNGYKLEVAGTTNLIGNTTITGTLSTTGTITSGAITYPNTTGTANQVLTTNGSGTASWTTLTLGSTTIDGLSDAKSGGTDFASSIILGHQTTGTLSNATENTAVGIGAISSITSGDMNVAVGYNALKSVTTGETNNAFGHQALFSTTTGYQNVGVGSTSLYSNTSGYLNTAMGYQSLRLNTTGNSNVGIGSESLLSNVAGSENNAFGARAMFSNTSGGQNVGLGTRSLWLNTTGAGNTSTGYQAAYGNTTSNYNTATGYQALYTNATGSNNTAIGASADVSVDGLTNATAIGYNAVVGASNRIQLGNSSVTSVVTSGTLSATGFTGPLTGNVTGNASTATALAAGKTISLTGDVAYTSGSFDGSSNVTGSATLTNTTVTAGSYGSSSAIPTFTVDSKGRLTAAGTVGITSGVSSLNYTTTTSYAAGGTMSGTSLTLTAADATNPGLVSTGAQTFAGAKTFNSDINVNGIKIGLGSGSVGSNFVFGNGNTLRDNSSGYDNMVFGQSVGMNNSSGVRNLAIGSESFRYNTNGSHNVAVGYFSLRNNSSGSYNIAIGENSSQSNTSGSYITTVGYGADVASNNLSNATAIGNGAIVNANNTIQLGNTSVTSVVTSGTISATGFSGPLTGNVTGNASTATKLAAPKNINGVAFDGSADITIGANSNSLTGTTLSSNVVSSSLTGLGTITSGTWNGSVLTPAYGGTGLTSLGTGVASFLATPTSSNLAATLSDETGSGGLVFATSPTLVTPNIGVASGTSLSLTGAITSGTWSASTIGVAFGGTGLTSPGASGNLLTSNGTSWVSSAPTGVNTLTYTSGTSYANGGTISGTTLTLSAADGTNPGLVSTGTQTFVGSKTFTATVTASGAIARGVNFTPTLNAGANNDVLVGLDINPTFTNGSYTGISNYGLRVDGIGIGRGGASQITNTAVGNSALSKNTSSGIYNTAMGYQALFSNTSGMTNTAIGAWSAVLNTTGNDNTSIGYNTLYNNSSGASNTAIGSNALNNLTTGNYNIGIGPYANYKNSTGSNNIAIGYQTIYSSSTNNTSDNIAIGYKSLYSSPSGNNNTAVGSQTLYSNTSGEGNAALGYQSLYYNQTGTYNTALGYNSGNVSTSNVLTKGIYIGANAAPKSSTNTNEIVIGADATGNGSNTTLIGNTSTQQSTIYGALTVTPNVAAANITGTSSTISAQNATSAGYGGGSLNLNAGNGWTTGLGGNIVLTPGTSGIAANYGIVKVNGQIQITGGSPAAGKVLNSDANGLATWQNSGGSIATMSATGTATSTATYIIFTGSTASQTITIPSAVTLGAGREITIKNVASVTVSIASAGGYLIQDNSTLTATGAALGIEPSNNWMKLVSDGTNWYIMRALF